MKRVKRLIIFVAALASLALLWLAPENPVVIVCAIVWAAFSMLAIYGLWAISGLLAGDE